jgi:hypothetical protein
MCDATIRYYKTNALNSMVKEADLFEDSTGKVLFLLNILKRHLICGISFVMFFPIKILTM